MQQQALKSLWTEELSEQLRQFSATPERKPQPVAPTESVIVRPSFQRERFPGVSPQQKPELSAALDAVVRAADLIKAAQDRAQYVEEQSRILADRTSEQLNAAEQQMHALQERAQTAEDRLAAVTERAAEKLTDADAQIRLAREQLARETERANAIEQRSHEQLSQAQMLIKDANERIFVADTRAMEAKEDLAYLENYIRERFAL